MRNCALFLCSVLFVQASAVSAGAQPRRRRAPPGADQPAPVDAATVRARESYERGRTAFAGGQFAEALSAFQAAYEARPHPTVLLPIAECHERMEHYRDAVETLERYLLVAPGAADADRIRERIAAHRARPAKLHVSSAPVGAAIRIDDRDTGSVTPAEVEVTAGTHAVELRLEGYDPGTQDVTVEFAEQREIDVSLQQSPTQPPSTEPEPTPVEPSEHRRGIGGYVAAGFAGVALVTGSVLGFLALSAQSDFEDDPTVDNADRAEELALFADIAFGVAAVAAVTSVIALLTDSDEPDGEGREARITPADAPALRLRWTPLALRQGAGVGAHIEF